MDASRTQWCSICVEGVTQNTIPDPIDPPPVFQMGVPLSRITIFTTGARTYRIQSYFNPTGRTMHPPVVRLFAQLCRPLIAPQITSLPLPRSFSVRIPTGDPSTSPPPSRRPTLVLLLPAVNPCPTPSLPHRACTTQMPFSTLSLPAGTPPPFPTSPVTPAAVIAQRLPACQ